MTNPLPLPPWTIHLLKSGTFGLDGGAIFGSVPKALWERTTRTTTPLPLAYIPAL